VLKNLILRRNLLKAGACAWVGASGMLRAANALALRNEGPPAVTPAEGSANRAREEMIRSYYSAYETRRWAILDGLLADDFTFTSPAGDDHISKSVYKERCWPTAAFVTKFEIECVMVRGDDGFVKYLLKTTDGKSLRNTEYFRFAGEKVKDVECYFGGKLGYPGQKA
jgi:hypothetical protein